MLVNSVILKEEKNPPKIITTFGETDNLVMFKR